MFPKLYAIIDAELLSARSIELSGFAAALLDAGLTLVQYRNKHGAAQAVLRDAATLRNIFPLDASARLIMNDRPDLALLAGFDGVHVGQEDLSIEDARAIVGKHAWTGVSTHTPEQVMAADRTSCDYIAYGPIFSTATKDNPDPTVGLAGLRAARAKTHKPLVAIGGITSRNCRAVLDAGADSVAVISSLLPATGESIGIGELHQIAREFLTLLG